MFGGSTARRNMSLGPSSSQNACRLINDVGPVELSYWRVPGESSASEAIPSATSLGSLTRCQFWCQFVLGFRAFCCVLLQ
jgi:hypothetical protein